MQRNHVFLANNTKYPPGKRSHGWLEYPHVLRGLHGISPFLRGYTWNITIFDRNYIFNPGPFSSHRDMLVDPGVLVPRYQGKNQGSSDGSPFEGREGF